MAKTLFWIVTFAGLIPSLLIAVAGVVRLFFARPMSRGLKSYSNFQLKNQEIIFHDDYITCGPFQIELHPQYWSVILLIVGIVAMVISLLSLLQRAHA